MRSEILSPVSLITFHIFTVFSIITLFLQLSDHYGNIFSLRLGSLNTVVVNTYSMVKKALTDQANIFTGRPTNDVLKRIIKCQGIHYCWENIIKRHSNSC